MEYGPQLPTYRRALFKEWQPLKEELSQPVEAIPYKDWHLPRAIANFGWELSKLKQNKSGSAASLSDGGEI